MRPISASSQGIFPARPSAFSKKGARSRIVSRQHGGNSNGSDCNRRLGISQKKTLRQFFEAGNLSRRRVDFAQSDLVFDDRWVCGDNFFKDRNCLRELTKLAQCHRFNVPCVGVETLGRKARVTIDLLLISNRS